VRVAAASITRAFIVRVDDRRMHAHRGQATIEALAVLALVAALVASLAAAGAFAWLPRAAERAAAAVAPAPPGPSAGDMAFLDRAVARPGDESGPLLRDAILRLGRSIGPAAARALAIDHLQRQYAPATAGRLRALGDPSFALARPAFNGVGSGTADVWSDEVVRAASTVRLINADDERRWRASQRTTIATRVVDLGVSGAIALAGAINPDTAVVSLGLSAGAAAMAVEGIGIPSGSRDDDVLLCRFVWRTNRARPPWVAAHPADALRLALDQRLPAVELTVVRAGAVLSRDVVRSDASTC
jgi:hypothetical protein